MQLFHPWLLVAASLCATIPAYAQDAYPSRPVRLLVSDTPGSAPDVLARKVAPEMAARMGQPWVVENRPGGGHLITAEACSKAPPDGYTLCITNIAMLTNNPLLVSKLPYDPDNGFRPVTNLFYLVEGFFVKSSPAIRTPDDLRALALAKPGALNFATLGVNTNTDIFIKWLNGYWKTEIAAIPYKGSSLMIAALLAGEIDFLKLGASSTAGLIKAGKIKMLAFNSAKRLPQYADVPTMDEVGLGGFDVRSWMGLSMPAGAPDAAVRRVNAEFVRAYREPGFNEFLESQFLDAAVGTPEEFAAFLKADRERAARLIKQFNIPRS